MLLMTILVESDGSIVKVGFPKESCIGDVEIKVRDLGAR